MNKLNTYSRTLNEVSELCRFPRRHSANGIENTQAEQFRDGLRRKFPTINALEAFAAGYAHAMGHARKGGVISSDLLAALIAVRDGQLSVLGRQVEETKALKGLGYIRKNGNGYTQITRKGRSALAGQGVES